MDSSSKTTSNSHGALDSNENDSPIIPKAQKTVLALVPPSDAAQCLFAGNRGEVQGRGAGTHVARALGVSFMYGHTLTVFCAKVYTLPLLGNGTENSKSMFIQNGHSQGTGERCEDGDRGRIPRGTLGVPVLQIQKTTKNEDFAVLHNQVIANFEKPNTPNINVPEKIIICLDVCCEDNNSLFRLADGTTFTPLNMMKRVIDFFIHSKLAINKKTTFALMFCDKKASWVQNSTNNIRNIFALIDSKSTDENYAESSFDFKDVFQLIRENVDIPEYRTGNSLYVPPYIVRLLVLYGRSNCIPIIDQDDPNLIFLKKQPYFTTDIIYAHEDDSSLLKCEEIYDRLQVLDNGYSYVYEVSRNAAKIHDCTAKLLAHPLQRVLQKNANYSFGKQL